jgi:hypothetical protein
MEIYINESIRPSNFSKDISLDSLIIEFKNFKNVSDIFRSKHLIKCINLINNCKYVNDTYLKFGVSKSLDYSIVFEIIKSATEGTALNEYQYSSLIKLYSYIDDFHKILGDDDFSDHYLDSDFELSLLGFNIDLYKFDKTKSGLKEQCYNLLSEFQFSNLKFNDMLLKIKEVLTDKEIDN